MTTAQKIRDAQTLADFSNANTAADAEYFHQNYADFFPRTFWNYQVRQLGKGEPIWTTNAAVAQAVERLRSEPPIPFWQAFQRVLNGAWQVGFPLEECVRLISCAAVPDRLSGAADVEPDLLGFPVWPYQRAVMLLGIEPWRASVCRQCRNRFVKDKPARQFCSDRCFSAARKRSKKAWWSEHGDEWRAGRSNQESKPKKHRKSSRRKKR